MKINYQTLENTLKSILLKRGFSEEKATLMATIFTETTFDGVFSHGINRVPRFIGDVDSGTVIPDAEPRLINGFSALEQWDGCQGPGILNALHCSRRSAELAGQFGIGCVGLRNTNHWMRGGTYGWKIADRGFLYLGWTNTIPNMPPWRGHRASLGNNPFIIAIPHPDGHIVLDMAMSLYSYGKLEWYKKCQIDLPEYGGYDKNDELTRDPSAILETERILPIGLWKGSALAMVLDLAAAILAGGNTSKKIGEKKIETDLSQVFISIDINRHMSEDQINSLIKETLDYSKKQNADSLYPGQRSLQNRIQNMEHGVEIPDETWDEILELQNLV